MLDKLNIIGFKSHGETNLILKSLTFLVGTNSGGKSSAIQSLLLLAQNVENKISSPLNGHLVSIGSFSEARNFITNAKSFEIIVTSGMDVIKASFTPEDASRDETKMEFISTSSNLADYINYLNKNIHYLSANRIGGQDLYSKNFDKYDEFGLNGEYSIDYLEQNKAVILHKNLINSDETPTLGEQVDFWLNYIFSQRINTIPIDGSDKIKAEFVLENGRTVRPKNTGSGLSYIKSILIICLSSKIGDLIIIENPEIHLHPKAQSLLLEFFIKISNSGRQLIIETHSDHFFNGLRVNINNKSISKESVAVNFLTLDSDNMSKTSLINISDNGRIMNTEDNLFDQFSKDMKSIVGF